MLLRHRATLGPGNQVLVDGRPWNAPDVARDVEAAAGPGTRLVESDAEHRFEILPLLIATDGRLTAVGYDRQWEGAQLRIAVGDEVEVRKP